MKSLIVEDEFVSRAILLEFLAPYGPCNVAVNGEEAIAAVEHSLASGAPYDLICLDIMMPGCCNGTDVLAAVRDLESGAGVMLGDGAKVFMTTAMDDSEHVMASFRASCDAYLIKPIKREKLHELVRQHLDVAAPA